MSITCSWEKPLGTCFSKYDEEKRNPLFIWGGGNCLAIITDQKKNLFMFFIDKEHFKNHELNGDEFTNIVLFTSRKKQCKQLLDCLYQAGFDFEVSQKCVIEKIDD